jgi:hypothetical protein
MCESISERKYSVEKLRWVRHNIFDCTAYVNITTGFSVEAGRGDSSTFGEQDAIVGRESAGRARTDQRDAVGPPTEMQVVGRKVKADLLETRKGIPALD